MKKKYEALAISFLCINLIYTYGVLNLQPSIGEEIVGELYRLFHLFNNNVVTSFGLPACCFLIGIAGSFVMAICGIHSHSPLSIIQGLCSFIQGLLGVQLMTSFLNNRVLLLKGLVFKLGMLSTITILFVLCNAIFSIIVEMAVRNHIQILDHTLEMPLIENLSLSILFSIITLIIYLVIYLMHTTNIYILFYLNIILLTGVLGCFSIGMSKCLRKLSRSSSIQGIILILICLVSFMRLPLIACVLCIMSILISIKKSPLGLH